MRPHPLLKRVEWIEFNWVRATFKIGAKEVTRDVPLPVKTARRAKVVCCGLGLNLGNGTEWSAPHLYDVAKQIPLGVARYITR